MQFQRYSDYGYATLFTGREASRLSGFVISLNGFQRGYCSRSSRVGSSDFSREVWFADQPMIALNRSDQAQQRGALPVASWSHDCRRVPVVFRRLWSFSITSAGSRRPKRSGFRSHARTWGLPW
jgi:hypothetical protein